VAAQPQEEIQALEKRMARLEELVEGLYRKLDLRPPAGDEGGGRWGGSEAGDPIEDPEIQDLLAKGNDAQAIKRYRELSGLGLKEAQEAIERHRA
jgi:ribosomal protein L7/L12